MLSDKTLSLVMPLVAYWSYASFFYWLAWCKFPWVERYRIHTPEEQDARNRVSVATVVRTVLFQQALQTGLGWLVVEEQLAAADVSYAWACCQFLFAMYRVFIDL